VLFPHFLAKGLYCLMAALCMHLIYTYTRQMLGWNLHCYNPSCFSIFHGLCRFCFHGILIKINMIQINQKHDRILNNSSPKAGNRSHVYHLRREDDSFLYRRCNVWGAMWELKYLPKLFEIISLFQTINDLLIFHPMVLNHTFYGSWF
jgi:hypothetical protein